MKLIPQIRFKGFTDDWEERKLKDIAQFNPKTVLPDEFEYVDLESVVGIEMISHRTESKDQAPSRAQRLAQKGDVFYQTVRPYQMNNYLYDLPYDNYVFSTGYAQMRPNIDSYFLLNSVQNKQFVQHVLDRSTGTSYPAINSSDLSNIEIHVPSKLSEQQKIGAFFQSIDDTIALHQRKLDLLKETKKGFLQKMFPKNGAKVPEIRFPGFTGNWEQRKLEDISDKVTEKNKNNEFTETLTNSAEFGIINQREFFDKDISNEKNLNGYYIVREDDFVYNPRISNYAPVGPIKRNKLGRTGVMSPLYYVFRPHDIDKKFLEYFFGTTVWHKFMKLNGDSGARADRFAIKDSVFKTMPIPYPSIEEQKKVGKFFDDLNDTIALHQRKLDLLKETKKGFLQKMF